jgi:hypothetical protein
MSYWRHALDAAHALGMEDCLIVAYLHSDYASCLLNEAACAWERVFELLWPTDDGHAAATQSGWHTVGWLLPRC